MTGARLQAVAALVMAAGLHVALLGLRPEVAGAVSSGEAGDDLVSLSAADSAMADLVAAWERPPVPVAAPVAPSLAMAALAPPVPPQSDVAAPIAPPPPPAMSALPETVPQADIALPLPPPPAAVAQPAPDPQLPDAHEWAEAVAPPRRPSPRPEDLGRETRPAAPAARASAPRPAQKAAGSGGGVQAGDGGRSAAATLSRAQETDLLAGWGASIRARVDRAKRHPGTSGSVTLRLTVTRGGDLASAAVAKSSGSAALDQAALSAVQRVGRFPPAPAGLGKPSYTFTLPIRFQR